MQDRPHRLELLQAVGQFLRDDLLPELEGRQRFHLLVALNLLEIVQREEQAGDDPSREEWTALASLLQEHPPSTIPVGEELRRAVRHGNERLCDAIRHGRFDDPDARRALLRHLRHTTRRKLEVANPRLLERMSGEDPHGPA